MNTRELAFGVVCGIVGAFMGAVVHDLLASIVFLLFAFVLIATSLTAPSRARYKPPVVRVWDRDDDDEEDGMPEASHRRTIGTRGFPMPPERSHGGEELLRGLNITRGRRVK